MDVTRLLIVSHALLALVAVVLWWRREARDGIFVPAGAVPNELYRALERARRVIFRNSRAVRFTVFRPVDDGALLAPIARLGWGRPSVESDVRFREGEGLAGQAWQLSPRSLLFAHLHSPDVEVARAAQRDLFDLRPEVANALSERQLSARSLVAIPLAISKRKLGVLTIDSLEPSLLPVDLGQRPELAAALYHLGLRISTIIEANEPLQTRSAPYDQGTSAGISKSEGEKKVVELVAC